MYKKSVMHVQSCCFAYKTYCFLTFSLPSASLDLKVPHISWFLTEGGRLVEVPGIDGALSGKNQ